MFTESLHANMFQKVYMYQEALPSRGGGLARAVELEDSLKKGGKHLNTNLLLHGRTDPDVFFSLFSE